MPSFKPTVESAQQPAGPISNEEILNASIKSHNIKSVKITNTNTIETYKPDKLAKSDSLNYSEVKKQFQNQDNPAHNRFKLHDLARGVMSVEQEEQVRIENEVQRRLKIIFEKMQDQVREEAYKEGFERGLKDGKTELLHTMAPAIGHFENLIQGFENAARDIVTANEEFIFRVVYHVVRKIVLKEVAEDKDLIKRSVAAVVDKLGTRENIKVFVSPALMADAEKLKADLNTSLGQLRNLTIEPDSRITMGGCRVETEFGTIDSSIDAQLANAAEFFKGLG